MKDLRDAIKAVIDDAYDTCEVPDGEVRVSLDKIKELENQYRLYFVEPEDDKDWKNYQDPLDK